MVAVSATDWETIRGCLREVALGFLEQDLDDYLRRNRPLVERLNKKVAEGGRQADELDFTLVELDLVTRCIRYTMANLDAGEFWTRVGPRFDEASRSLERLEATLSTARH